ncbi:MAG: hypothetical protein Q7R92_00385 [bacterium]|nr:hypothetical protein [bacterium]
MDNLLFIINILVATLAGLYGPDIINNFLKWLHKLEQEERNEKQEKK